eukprot:TRINITY_DN3354_c0_g1_i1.p1 TRINITY_DN3354_c0_g1~~TRINITY_DN3354_c0_g1_i1.p1  ORF type:complete len:900 (-),score=293.96 TRINITY_DN3354_c0_g1_i1:72-2771(-)
MRLRFFLLFTVLFSLYFSLSESKILPENEQLEIFIVAHSHDDVGWKSTWEEYYSDNVKKIFESVLVALEAKKDRKFMQVEIAYFSRWWNEIDESKRKRWKKLVDSKQIEYNLGGICMNDEAVTTYYEEVNQLTNGALWLQQNLGVKPTSVWQIDAFGHSSATASLISQMEYPYYVINRIPFHLKDQMKKEKSLEFIWRSSTSLGSYREIFTHVLSDHYHTPSSFNFVDNFDVAKVSLDVVKELRQRQNYYRHNKQLVTWGYDFAHQEAGIDYQNMDKVIQYINSNKSLNMTLRYAVLSDYLEAVRSLNLVWQVREGDFFPHNDGDHSFWTGYYTSRPWTKIFLRQNDALLQIAETLLSGTSTSSNFTYLNEKIETLRLHTSVATHHDAITGTEKSKVNDDYVKNIQFGAQNTNTAIEEMISKRFKASTSSKKSYTVHNSLGWSRREFVNLATDFSSAQVECNGVIVPSQVNPVPSFSKVKAKYRLYFLASIPPLSTLMCNIQFGNGPLQVTIKESNGISLSNKDSTLKFDGNTGKLIQYQRSGAESISLSMDLFEYSSASKGDGAYLFRPSSNTPKAVSQSVKNVLIEGKLVKEIQQFFKKDYGQSFISYNDSGAFGKFFEIVYEVGPLSDKGRQLITRINSNLDNQMKYYTDDNGMEIMPRTFNRNATELVSGNYYPMVQRVFMRDEKRKVQLNLLGDSSHGSASLAKGQLEVMLHRRCAYDDSKGVEEVLDDKNPIRTSLRMNLADVSSGTADQRFKSILQQFPLVAIPMTQSFESSLSSFGLKELPLPIHLMTLRRVDSTSFLVRFQHIFAASEHPNYSIPFKIDLNAFLADGFKSVQSIQEMNLSGNIPLSQVQKLKWKASIPPTPYKPIPFSNGILTIQPMEIRTFRFNAQSKA